MIDADAGDALQDFQDGAIGQLADVGCDNRVDDFGGNFLEVLRRLQRHALTGHDDLIELIVGLGRAGTVVVRCRVRSRSRSRSREGRP